MNRLNPQAVTDLYRECLAAKDEAGTDIEALVGTYRMNPDRIESNRQAINDMLAELPADFHMATGGGQSFLYMCNDRSGQQWTGEHQVMEQLYVLGKAAELATMPLGREMWDALPGGVPYITIWPELPAEVE